MFVNMQSLQALIQYSDADTALNARNALDGRSIPRFPFLLLVVEILAFIYFFSCSCNWC